MFHVLSLHLPDDLNRIVFDMVKFLPLKERIKHYPHFLELYTDETSVEWGMKCAAQGGHRELVDFFISKGATDWDVGSHLRFGDHVLTISKSCDTKTRTDL